MKEEEAAVRWRGSAGGKRVEAGKGGARTVEGEGGK